MLGPVSSYSDLVIQLVLNVANVAKTEPPIHTENFLSLGVITFTLVDAGTIKLNSLSSLSFIFGNIVVPPERVIEL